MGARGLARDLLDIVSLCRGMCQVLGFCLLRGMILLCVSGGNQPPASFWLCSPVARSLCLLFSHPPALPLCKEPSLGPWTVAAE